MAVAITQDYNTNEFAPKMGGDIAIVTLFLDYTVNYPGNPGESLDLSPYFREVHAILLGGYSAIPGGGAWNGEIYIPTFRQSTPTTWLAQFFAQDGAAGQLTELGAGAYASQFRNTVAVIGRPAANAS